MVNKVILIGNLGSDPEVRTLDNGVKVANFTMATSERYKGSDGDKKEITTWHNIVVWRQLAEICETYLKKGDKIYIEGKITKNIWEGDDGQKKYKTEIVGYQMQMLGGNKEKKEPQREAPGAPISGDNSDDLPF